MELFLRALTSETVKILFLYEQCSPNYDIMNFTKLCRFLALKTRFILCCIPERSEIQYSVRFRYKKCNFPCFISQGMQKIVVNITYRYRDHIKI